MRVSYDVLMVLIDSLACIIHADLLHLLFRYAICKSGHHVAHLRFHLIWLFLKFLEISLYAIWMQIYMSIIHYYNVIMGAMASRITSLTIVSSTVYSDADQSKHQSSASLAFERGIHWGPVNSPHKWPVTQKMFPFDDVIMIVAKIKIEAPADSKDCTCSRYSVHHNISTCILCSFFLVVVVVAVDCVPSFLCRPRH